MKKSIHRYRYEIAAAALIGVGLFILAGPGANGQTFSMWFWDAVFQVQKWLYNTRTTISQELRRPTTLVGLALLVGGLYVLLLRVRQRLLSSERLRARTCPKCGAAVERQRNRGLDHVLSRFLPLWRYRCESPECDWTGRLSTERSGPP